MRINSVQLNNYRVHRDKRVKFTQGLNLLLGENGSGKSSFLEAAGLALFDVKPRTAISEAVMLGEKSADIRVEFTGNDGLDYAVERRIGAGQRVRLFRLGEKKPLLENAAVYAKIGELAGIPQNAEPIFKNVITAQQNRFTDIFSDTEAQRKSGFNLIFNTEIYKTMVDGFLKDTLEGYKVQKTVKTVEISTLQSSGRDLETIDAEIGSEKAVLLTLHGEGEGLSARKKELSDSENHMAKQSEERRQKEISRAAFLRHLESSESAKTAADANLEASIAAAKIVESKAEAHRLYGETDSKLGALDREIGLLEKTEKEFHGNTEKRNALEVARKTAETRIQGLKASRAEKEQELSEQTAKVAADSADLNTLLESRSELTKSVRETAAAAKTYRDAFGEWQQSRGAVETLTAQLSHQEQSLSDYGGLDEKIKLLSGELSVLESAADKLKPNREELQKNQSRMEELLSAEATLKTGICPFLHEECLNISGGSLSGEYFERRKTELEKEEKALTGKVNELKILEEKADGLKDSLSAAKSLSEQAKSAALKLEKMSGDRDAKQGILHAHEMRLKDMLTVSRFAADLAVFLENSDYAGADSWFSVKNGEMAKDLQSRSADIERRQKEHQEQLEKQNVLARKIKDEQAKIVELETEIVKNESLIAELDASRETLRSALSALPEYRKERIAVREERDRLLPDYQLFMENRAAASKTEHYRREAQRLSADIARVRADMDAENRRLAELDRSYSAAEHEGLKQEIVRMESLLRENSKAAGEHTQKIAGLEEEKRKTGENRDRIHRLGAEIARLDRKIALSDAFRNEVRDMGAYVSERLMEMIGREATANYRKITGRKEKVLWSNREEAFLVTLLDEESGQERKFQLLSGGEQVAAALSMRAAMASILTRGCGLAIFDEPTVNLDNDRKLFLAEAIRGIVKSLEQTILVTHDSIFEESAEMVERLDRPPSSRNPVN